MISDASKVNTEDLEDALDDLAHDLGKYIHLPLSLLPNEATDSEFRAAAVKALLETRRGPSGTQSAQTIWSQFRDEVGNELEGKPGWTGVVQAVDHALAWASKIRVTAHELDRAELMNDLTAVTPAIRTLRSQLDG